MNKSERRSAQLGMPYGTAVSKLRKSLLFSMAQRLNLDSCVRCEQKINKIEEFTIEHILPWENVNPDLFWDLNNIAFSHSRCNIPHKQNGGNPSKRFLNGLWLCLECKRYKNEDEFSLYKAGTPRSWCKICRAKRKKQGKVI